VVELPKFNAPEEEPAPADADEPAIVPIPASGDRAAGIA
jgi:hypothetical protein